VTEQTTRWCLDSSALINPWNRYYAPDITPWYWRGLPPMVGDGRVILSEEVRDEVERQDDRLREWARANISSWHPLTDDVQDVVTEIMSKWGKLVDHRKDRSRADPFVIATAKVVGATVVTDEKYGSAKDPRIPYVCNGLSVRCIDVYAFVRETGLSAA